MSDLKPLMLATYPTVTVEEYYVDEAKRISGNPKQSLWIEYQDRSDQFFAGIWASEIGEWRISYTEEEYCCILTGESVITSSEGETFTVRSGDEFVIPAGFTGTWKVIEPTKKRFVVYEKA